MHKVETKYHIITANDNDKPAFICTGLCESVWWLSSFPGYTPLSNIHCEKCGGKLRAAKPEDYKVIDFKISDQNAFGLFLSHDVKEEYKDFALANWCKTR